MRGEALLRKCNNCYDTFILRLQSIVGSPEGERGMRLLRKPQPWLASGTPFAIPRHGRWGLPNRVVQLPPPAVREKTVIPFQSDTFYKPSSALLSHPVGMQTNEKHGHPGDISPRWPCFFSSRTRYSRKALITFRIAVPHSLPYGER